MPSNPIEIRDSRRLTGPNLLWDRPGAIMDLACPGDRIDAFLDRLANALQRILDTVGWKEERQTVRRFPGGASVAISAPIDGLYAATEVCEFAFEAARARLAGGSVPEARRKTLELIDKIKEERNPALLCLRDAAESRGVAFLPDDELVTVGMGAGSLTFPVREIPDPEGIDWSGVRDIPVAIITGTNGKSTCVRLLASMARAAGMKAGFSCTDGIFAGGDLVEPGDYSGPEGTRGVLRNREVEIAFLETARGGLLRRGLTLRRADAALITNVGEDHLGEFGVADFESLLATKLIVGRAVDAGGRLVLNAEDPALLREGRAMDLPVAWFAREGGQELLRAHIERSGDAAWVEEGRVRLSRDGESINVIDVEAIPITLKGAAAHNVSNSLASVLVGAQLGLGPEAIAAGLGDFTGEPEENPGRGNLFDLGGVTVIVDFAHNPHGFRALFAMAAAMPAARRLLLVGQAGDREDDAIRGLAREAMKAGPDRIVIKEMTKYLRGRREGEIPAMLLEEFLRLGARPDQVERAASEMEGARKALEWSRPGDLLLLTSQASRDELIDLLRRLGSSGWKPGSAIPS